MPATVLDVTDETFATDVLEASRRGPVVVDFWAPWCGPCQSLGPTLERVAAESADVTLVKVNTDENPRVSQAYGIQSIPAVKAFRDGQVVSEFLGAVPEPEVRRFFGALAPSPGGAHLEAGDAALAAGDLPTARRHFEGALAADPSDGRAAGRLLAVLLEYGELDAADALAERFAGDPEVMRIAPLVRFIRAAEGADEEALQARVQADEGDLEAWYTLGAFHAAQAEWEAALECFLTIVQTDRGFREDVGRFAMLDIFRVLGDEHPVTLEYRSRLTMVLF